MTVKKALEVLEEYCKQKINLKNGLQDPTKSWNADKDLINQVANMMIDSIETDIVVLNALTKLIKPTCKHPKKMRDHDGKGWYCMNCNLDL